MRGDSLLDHCHTGWSGSALITLAPGKPRLRLSGSPALKWLHLYSPPDQDFFCIEPVTHRPDALNAPDPQAEGVRVLQPGETLEAVLTLDIVDTP
jgi:aldose 1-epimerase